MPKKFDPDGFLNNSFSGTEKVKEIERLKEELEQLKNEAKGEATQIPLKSIVLPTEQPRRYFAPEAMQYLVNSVKQYGILQPVLVRCLSEDKYELVAGERRYRAAVEVGLAEIPVVIKNLTNEEAKQVAIIENLQREDLNPVEETEGILTLLSCRLEIGVNEVPSLLNRMYNEVRGKTTYNVIGSEQGLMVESVFSTLGRMTWESFVINRMSLINLPEDILSVLREGKIEYTKAKVIAAIKDELKRGKILEEAINQNLSLSQIKEKIKAINSSVKENIKSPRERFDEVIKRAKKAKVWEKETVWKEVEVLLNQIEQFLE